MNRNQILNKFHKMSSYNIYKNILKDINKINYLKQYETRDMKINNKVNNDYSIKQNEITTFINMNKNKNIKRPLYLYMKLSDFCKSTSKNTFHYFGIKLFGK